MFKSPLAKTNQHTLRVVGVRPLGFMVVTSNKTLLSIKTRYASKAYGSGYCGAGSEDYIELFEITNNRLHLVDALNIQSCLKNIELNGDSDEEKEKSVILLMDSDTMSVDWFDNGTGTEEHAKYRITGNGFEKLAPSI